MTSTNGTIHNGDAAAHAGIAVLKFDPTATMQFWQKATARFTRANEQLFKGLTTAARMQVELGQELMQSQMAALKHFTPGEKPEAILKTQIAHQTDEADHLFESIRKISDEIRHSFTEATRTLMEAEVPEVVESIAAAARKGDYAPARRATAVTTVETRS
jgi:hypothetical protein